MITKALLSTYSNVFAWWRPFLRNPPWRQAREVARALQEQAAYILETKFCRLYKCRLIDIHFFVSVRNKNVITTVLSGVS